jgi:hypothetical protein
MREPYSFILSPSIQIDDDMVVTVDYQGAIHGGRAVLVNVTDQKGRPFVHLSLSVEACRALYAGLQIADEDSFGDIDD